MKNLVGYLVAVAGTLYWFFLYDNSSVSWLLAAECIYPVIAIIYLAVVTHRMKIQPMQTEISGEKDKKVHIGLVVSHRRQAEGAKYRLRIGVRRYFSEKATYTWLTGNIAGAAEGAIWYDFCASDCGRVAISGQQLRIYDFTGIFYRKLKIDGKVTVTVWPSFDVIPMEITKKTREFPADAEDYSAERGGGDPSEIYQIREYHEGDAIHDIHWKLSAKEDTLMVKENGLPLGCVILLWIDLSAVNMDVHGYGQLIETAASIAITLTEKKCIHMAAWFDEESKCIIKRKIDSEEAVYEMVQRLLMQQTYREATQAAIYYEEAFRGVLFSSIVQINGRNEVWVNGEKQEFLRL